jgi:hypothetical protein
MLEEALPDCVRVLGESHVGTLRSRNDLALAYLSLERPGDAVPLFDEALEGLERVLGPGHPTTVSVRENLARARRQASG